MKGNIAIFVPHVGCPHRCSFCDQTAITGTSALPDGTFVTRTVSDCLTAPAKNNRTLEIAFFGGSFTAIPRDYMRELLAAAAPFVQKKQVAGIRISTRPDAIDGEVLSLLRQYGVTAIELGAQSMDDGVLAKNRRGHTAADVIRAARLIRESGFELGLQMMTGLYGSSPGTDRMTAGILAALQPDTMRIYPTVTLKNTRLAQLLEQGEYTPPTLSDSVSLCAELLLFFADRNINVIKLGLHASADVEQNYLAGAYHPAFRELCEGKIYLDRAQTALCGQTGNFTLSVRPDCVSKMAGQHRQNLTALAHAGKRCKIREDSSLALYEVRIFKEQE